MSAETPDRSRMVVDGAHRLRLSGLSLFLGDVASFAVACLVGLWFANPEPVSFWTRMLHLDPTWHGWTTLLVFGVLLAHFHGRGHYTQRVSSWSEFGDILRLSSVAFLCDFFLTIALYQLPLSLSVMLRWAGFVLVAAGMRFVVVSFLDRAGLWTLRTLIVGDAEAVEVTRAALESERSLGYRVVGGVSLDAIADHPSPTPWRDLMNERGADFVVLASAGSDQAAVVSSLAHDDVPFAAAPMMAGLPVRGFSSQYFLSHDVLLLVSRGRTMRMVSRKLKVAFDAAVAAFLLMLLAPLFAVIAVMIKRDGGAVFYSHERIGTGGRRFGCFKFRSMVANSAEVLRDLLERDPQAAEEWAETQKLRDDPRITPIGRLLRKTSMDELPQLLNVLRGDMSLVGPRPIVSDEVSRYGDDIRYYYNARPGMTGLWQVSGRSDTSYEHRVRLDVWHVRNWTLWHDLGILLRTIPTVLFKRGAV